MNQEKKLTIIVINPPDEKKQEELFKNIEEYIQSLYM